MAITLSTIYRLVSKLRREQSDWELTIEQAAGAGMTLRAAKKKYQVLNTRLKFIIEKYYEEYSKVNFLRAVAHNL